MTTRGALAPVDFKAHWEAVHEENGPADVSWFQASPVVSLDLVAELGIGREAHVLDAGCGQHGLVGALAARGFTRLTALDVSAEALRRAREKLGATGRAVAWVEADVRDYRASAPIGLWHDRALLHFFTQPADQARYLEAVQRSVAPGGHVILAAFAPDGPEKCSGLPVVRRNAEDLAAFLGPGFAPRAARRETHRTPWGKEQVFQWAAFTRV